MRKKMARKRGSDPPSQESLRAGVLLHLRFGWWSLLGFLTLGIVLEAMHGFKIGWLMDADVEVRRLMWRLAHAHGTLLALVNIAFGTMLGLSVVERPMTASFCLISASMLIPLGFLLGGIFIYDGDPGLGIMLVPVGALLLFWAVLVTARSIGR